MLKVFIRRILIFSGLVAAVLASCLLEACQDPVKRTDDEKRIKANLNNNPDASQMTREEVSAVLEARRRKMVLESMCAMSEASVGDGEKAPGEYGPRDPEIEKQVLRACMGQGGNVVQRRGSRM